VNGNIGLAEKQRFFDLFDEQPLAAYVRQTSVLNTIARRSYVKFCNGHFGICRTQQTNVLTGLR
jgi:hypothetical protein